jgi:hypothetical protein
MTFTYLLQLVVLLKITGPTIVACTATRHQLSLYGAGLHRLDVDSVNSSSDYFAYLCVPVSETTLQQKRRSIGYQFHLQWQTVETDCKNEPC